MLELFFFIIFSIAFIWFCSIAKRYLYIHEHDASIRKELAVFDENLEKIEDIISKSNFELSNNHLYSSKNIKPF